MNRHSKNVERGIILKYHFIYRRIGSYLCDCPIVLNSEGFKHLIYSNNKRRPLKDIRHRVSFIPLIPRILEACPEPVEIRGQKEKLGDQVIPVRYYAYETSTNEGRIRLITRQKFNKTPRFLSLIEIR
ncbi:hypothetical protein J6T21_01505 [Candidatus Saccharibacteria bacterium]|nr:hypothetical protein [Candidatus Saccharibacteria bacterium]